MYSELISLIIQRMDPEVLRQEILQYEGSIYFYQKLKNPNDA
ncbi:hypothetical protein CLERM_697 [Coxiella-like endosymbiont]|nr:hypothetical protein CLERM_697 [Coxiella-like endosymbiont]